MSVAKYKDPITGAWIPVPALKIMMGHTDGSAVGVPAGIVAEVDRVVSSIQGKIVPNSVNFIAISDMHEMGDGDEPDKTIMERYRRANLNAGQGARLIAEKISPDFFVNLGDLAWGTSSTTHDLAQSITNAKGYTAGMEPLTECFYIPGNHDTGYPNGDFDESLVTGMVGNYRYKDLTAKKVRVICLNTADNTDGTDSCERISGEQLQWFADALDLSDKSDAARWGILILSHHPLDWGDIKPAADCLSAYVGGIKYSVVHGGVGVNKDFTGKNAAAVIANFHGHTHCFKVGDISGTQVQRVAIPNACYSRDNEYGRQGDTQFGETVTYGKSDDNTGKNTAFCVISVDLDRKTIYADCFGAGYDRVIHYGSAEDIETANLVPTSEAADSTAPYNGIGYKNGVYLSSNGGESTDAACVATGYIPYDWTVGNVLYIKGATVSTASHVRIYGYTEKGTMPSSSACCSGQTLDVYFTVEELSDNFYKLTTRKTVGMVKYLRLSLIGTGENLIVTVNTPI